MNQVEKNEALILAVQSGYPDTINKIKAAMEMGANIHCYDDYAIRHVVETGGESTLQALLPYKPDLDAQDGYPLYHATVRRHVNMVRMLLEHGADVRANGDEAMKLAVLSSSDECKIIQAMMVGYAGPEAGEPYLSVRQELSKFAQRIASLPVEWRREELLDHREILDNPADPLQLLAHARLLGELFDYESWKGREPEAHLLLADLKEALPPYLKGKVNRVDMTAFRPPSLGFTEKLDSLRPVLPSGARR